MRIIKKGATSQSIYFEVLDSTSTTGGRKTGLVFNTSSLTAYYVRNGGSATQITLATLTNPNSAWSSGGFKEVDATNMPGIYRLDVPDAAFASGAESVVVTIKGATGMVQVSEEIQLVAADLQDSVRAGLTALPNAAAEAAGGLYTRGSGAGQINQPANGMVDANVVRNAGTAITSSGGRQEVNTTHVAGTAQTAGDIIADTNDIQARLPAALVSGRIDASVGAMANNVLTAAAINADAITDAKVASDVTISSVTGSVGSVTSGVTVSTNNDKTGYGLSAAAVQAIWDALTSALTAAGSIGKWIVDKLDVVVSTRLASASYTAPLDAAGVRSAVGLASANLDTQLTTIDDYIDTEVGAIKAKTDQLTFSVANQVDSNVVDWKGAAAPNMTGDAYARLGGPAGASVSADIAAVKTDTAAIKAKTDNLPSDPADASDIATATGSILTDTAAIKAKTNNLPASPAATGDIPSAAAIADAVWDEDITTHTTPDSAGEALQNAGAAGTPPTADEIANSVWDEILGDHTVSGSTAEALSDLLANVFGIYDKTVNLPADPASTASLNTLFDNLHADHVGIQDNVGTVLAAVGALPTAAANADAVWDENIVAAHQTDDSAGKKLSRSLILYEGS